MARARPMLIVGAVFAVFGLVFSALGLIFVMIGREWLPALFTAAAWADNAPDALAFPIIGLVFTLIGLIFAGVGIGLLLHTRREKLLREELLRFGTRVTGSVADIRIDRSVRINGRSPLRILVQAQHPYTGMMQTLRGPMVWQTNLSVGDATEVLFDPQDEKKYAVLLPGEEAGA